jgi:sugar phosphate isomerase/epimerase
MITYCTNIHPGESWADTLQNLHTHLPVIASAVAPDQPFPVGLRLSQRAAMEIDQRSAAEFIEWMQRNNLYVPTLNGFPYGSFHSATVKEKVYLPDWRSQERVDYTKRLAELLNLWLPHGTRGSLSTVPVGFKSNLFDNDLGAVRRHLVDVLEHLDRLHQASGKQIILALEPEPGCLLETARDVVSFFERMDFPVRLRDRIGICFDCCHHAVAFENPADALISLATAGIPIGKVQISSAPRIVDPETELLRSLCEPTYLHQTVIRSSDGTISRYNDLPDAIHTHHRRNGDEWRIHFHLPVFLTDTPWCGTTQDVILATLPLLERGTLLEIETYTREVLPAELQLHNVTDFIIHEIEWLKALTT